MYIRTIKVLVVDDSVFFRNFLQQGMEKEERIEVVGTAGDPYEARDKILKLEPDVITLDIEMPQMDGVEFLRRLMPQYPLPVIVISGHEEKKPGALAAGAVDFLKKPARGDKATMDAFVRELAVRLKIASTAKVGEYKSRYVQPGGSKRGGAQERIIAIGASTGGTEAVLEVVRGLPRNMPGIVVVQHMPEGFTKMYANRLNEICRMEAKEAQNGDPVLAGRILIAPGGLQMKLEKGGQGYYVEVFPGEPVNGHKPSVDVLFHSAARLAGKNALGVILTGMGSDGAKGIRAMKDAGAHTIGQDEKTCVVYGMPKAAYDLGGISEQLPIHEIAQKLYTLAHL